MSTNITEPHRHAFQALVSGEYDNFALFSVFVDGVNALTETTIAYNGKTFRGAQQRRRRRR